MRVILPSATDESPDKDVCQRSWHVCGMGVLNSYHIKRKKIRVLSGGEKVRVLLSRMMIEGSNVLILDEPTDHLDMEGITTYDEYLESDEMARKRQVYSTSNSQEEDD